MSNSPSTRPGLILAVCCLSLFLVGLDNTIVNVALPAIQRELHTSLAPLQWTVDSYQLVLGCLLLLAGSIADRLGRRRTFQAGLAVFSTASLLCGLAPGAGWLVAFRVLQAAGGSMMNPVAMSIVAHAYPEPAGRARAFGVWSGVYGASMALGPILGGTLVGGLGWRSTFWINVPLGLAAIALTARFVPESRAPRPRRLDPVGQALIIVALGALMYAIIEGPGAGWADPFIVGGLVVCVTAAAAFAGYESRRSEPLLAPSDLRSRRLAGGVLIALCGLGATGGFLFVNTLYLQDVRGLSPLEAAVATLPLALMTMVFAPISGRIVASRGPRVPLVMSGLMIAVGGLVLTTLTRTSPYGLLLSSYVAIGIGFGLLNAPITAMAVSALPAGRSATASAIASTGRQVGQALGVAVLPAVVSTGLAGPLSSGLPEASHAAWWIVVGCGLSIAAIAVVTTRHGVVSVRGSGRGSRSSVPGGRLPRPSEKDRAACS